MRQSGQRGGDEVGSVVIRREQPWVAAVARRDGHWATALVGRGRGVSAEHRSVLEVALRLLHGLSGGAPSGPPASSQRSCPELVFPPGHVVGRSPAMTRVYDQLRAVVRGTVPVLVVGETGVGKEHVARIVHASSDRAAGPFVAVNCAAIPADLLEAELFGIEAGVATGVSRRAGRLQLADGGVLLLDEVADMALPLQAKVLRALQEREVSPVGARVPVAVDVRVVAATSADPEPRMAAGTLRRELYYRIAGATIRVPPLRERREDIPFLVEHFLRRASDATARSVRGMSVAALAALQEAPWPGNVRQLEHEVSRLVLACPEGQAIESRQLAPAILQSTPEGRLTDEGDLDLKRAVEEVERRLIGCAVARCRGNLAAAARELGVTRNGLVLKMQRLGIGSPRRSG